MDQTRAGVLEWQPFQHDSRTYDLSHLHPCRREYVQPAKGGKPERRYKVDVIFSLHCFTRGAKDGETPDPALFYSDHRETRIFDFRRYELSRYLPGIVNGLGERRCYHTGKENFFTIEVMDRSGNRLEYEIYFTASRSSKRGVINLFVQSAHVRDEAHTGNRPDKNPSGSMSSCSMSRTTGRSASHNKKRPAKEPLFKTM